MLDLIKNNQKHLENLPLLFKNNKVIRKIAEKLNKDKLIIISWLRWVWKANIINSIIQKSNYKNNYFYFNKDLDYNNKLKTEKDFNLLFYTYTERYNIPSIVILENSHNIDWFKNFLAKLYAKKQYKIIIIWNDIKIWKKPKINIYPISLKQLKEVNSYKLDIIDLLKFGSLQETFLLKSDYLKTKYLSLQKSDIIYNDIIKPYSLKNIDLHSYTITFLSLLDTYTSLRELNKSVNANIKLSLITMIEYVDYSIEAQIISKMYRYDLKKKKEITSKAKYYFSDLGIRNSFNWFNTDSYTLKENLIYNELTKKWYKVNWWINWKFDFSFIGKKISYEELDNQWFLPPLLGEELKEKIKINTLHIHMSKRTDKEDIKKEVRKLLKIGFVPTIIDWTDTTETISKYLIVENIKEIWLKKLQYENVKIMEFEEFIKEVLA